ncbi:protein dopey-2 [Crotalus adamanteus]|uniref:Protein dopey-2 n=1 Tax=Crotalus adamanteus TaxID=8729 RepID=A0AAW1BK64_CROAD
MDPEEQELLGDYRYRNYSSAIDKALRNFESSSEWADLISSLGKLNKALQSNLKYSLLPRRLIISKRLSQCLHPALPSGVHIKALESYEVIFKIIGTKWLAKDLFLYSSGLFPLLGVAALSVKPVLLDLYENYFLPLHKSLLPSLQAFLIGLLPGLEEGSEFYDRTDALLVKLSLVIGKEVFYSALWASVLVSPSVRLPASLFVVSHINRAIPGKQQNYMMGTDPNLTIQAICLSMLDSNVLVQRNTLEVVLFFFPLYSSLDQNESAIPLSRSDVVHLLSAAVQTLLRRDMSLNRRLYSWLLGYDIKGSASVPDLSIKASLEDYACSFFEKYSKELLVEGLIEILHQKFSESDLEEQHHAYLKPFRILISLLDKPEIGPLVIADLFLEVIRAFYRYCKETLGSDLKLSYSQTGNVFTSAIKENKNASEIVKTANMLITSLNTDFLWDYMTSCTEDCLSNKNKSTQTQLLTNSATVSELCTLIVFLLDVIPLELYSEVQSLYLPQMLSCMVQSLLENMEVLSLSELTYVFRTCFKVLSKVQMPSAYLSTETGSSDSSPVKEDSQEISSESQVLEDEEHIPLPSMKSEDSGIALSASSPELLQHLRIPRIIPDKDDVWKKGGNMQMTLHYIQELKGLKPSSPSDECDNPRDKEEKEWDFDQVMFDLGDTREDCREAFSALCYLLLDCTTFPVYLSEEESELLHLSLFQVSGGNESSFPLWLKSLMTICCCVNDCYIQNLAISVLLEVINHSQSLALVIEDRIKRYKIPGQNPFFGRLQMVTVPPIAPGILKLLSEKTDFYQRVAQVLWNQLNKETREHHNTCVELFYRLHCLAPSANICEDIICHALLDHDKCMTLEALFRFSILWHLTREIQGSRTTSHSRSFDRSLFVVLDSLNYSDGAISAAAQGWLIRALSLNDVTRILEPALLLLLHPKTQRVSLHCIKQKNSAEDISLWYKKKTVFQESVKSQDLCESSSEETLPLSQFTVVDREAIWAEVEKDPEKSLLKNEFSICKNLDELVNQYEHEVLKMSTKMSASINYKRENITPDYPLTLLEGLTTIGHFCLLDHPNHTRKSPFSADPTSLRNARNAILEEFPRIINTMSLLWNVIKKEDSQKRPSDFLGVKGCSSIYFKATKILKNKILDFLNPLTGQLGVQLIAATAAVWSSKRPHKYQTKMPPKANTSQLILVDLVCALNTLKTDIILQLIKEVVKKPSQIKGEEKSALVDIPVLHFCNAFIQRLPVSALQENFQSLLGVFKESVQLNLAPPGHFLLLSTLNDFVTRTPSQENKKNQKDLQDVTQKILEAVGNIAASSLEQTSWLSRNLEVKAQSQISLEESNVENNLLDHSTVSSVVSASAPSIYSVQALTLLAEVLASLLDMVYQSDEKEKAIPLISRLLYYVFPYLRNHSAYNLPSFHASTQLLSSLSGYAYTKRAWKKDVLDLFMDPAFFQMDTSCIHWRTIIDHLLTHEKTMFKDLMNMQSSSLKLFPSFEQKAMLLKRQAFAVFSGEIDQYHLYLPLIQERLTDNLRVGHTSSVAAQMFLFFRVLLLRISPQHLTSLWPIMVTELIQTFIQLEEILMAEPAKNNKKMSRQKAPSNGSTGFLGDIHQNELTLYLSACKFLDTALSFPSDKMQLFQMYKWAFVPEVDMESCSMISDVMENHQECKPHVARIMDLLKLKYGEQNISDEATKNCDFPLLDFHSESALTLPCQPSFDPWGAAFTLFTSLWIHTIPPTQLSSGVKMAAVQTQSGGILLSALCPKFLHTNSTSHTWPFSAVAELIDNAYDPDVNAKQMWIDKTIINENVCLTFMDNGNGMNADKLHKMLSFGFSDKVTLNGHVPVGLYGNGFKSGSMRLGKDAIVFTKNGDIMSVGLLSQTFLELTKAEHVIVPIISLNKSRKVMKPDESAASLKAILEHSLFSTEEELLAELDAIIGRKGTRIIIWNLRREKNEETEFDFDTDKYDIRIPADLDEVTGKRGYKKQERQDHIVPESDYSLRAYCSILYLKPRMQIIIRGQKVQTQLVSKSLAHIERDVYKPKFLAPKTVRITFGFNCRNKDHYGMMMYHRNRLIKAYERVGYQLKANNMGVGVIGIIECNFLKPTHNKQDFDYTNEYRRTIHALGEKLNDYWNEMQAKKTEYPLEVLVDDTQKLPDGINHLPEKWYCSYNPDPQFRNCNVPEEPEDDDLIPYEKTHKKKDREKLKKRLEYSQQIYNEMYLQTSSVLSNASPAMDESISRLHVETSSTPLNRTLNISDTSVSSPHSDSENRLKRKRTNSDVPLQIKITRVTSQAFENKKDNDDDNDVIILEENSTPKPATEDCDIKIVKVEGGANLDYIGGDGEDSKSKDACSEVECTKGTAATQTEVEWLAVKKEEEENLKSECSKCRNSERKTEEDEMAVQLDDLFRQLDKCSIERDQYKNEIELLEMEKNQLHFQCEELKTEIGQLKASVPQTVTQTNDSVASNLEEPVNYSDGESLKLRSLRVNVGLLLATIMPDLDLKQVNYDVDVVDEILGQVVAFFDTLTRKASERPAPPSGRPMTPTRRRERGNLN